MVCRVTLKCLAIAILVAPPLNIAKAKSLSVALRASGRPNLVPFFLAAASPALTRSRIKPRSNSASEPKMGANQQKALKFHGILANLLTIMAYRRFLLSQILADFRGCFLRAYNPTESIIFSSEKSYSPCKLKWLHRMTESFRMASMSSFLRSSLLSLPSSFAR